MEEKNKHIKIIIAGGGTGGHIFPAVAIANALKKDNSANEILFVGALGKMEMEKVPKEGYKIIGLPIAGFNRSNLLKNIFLPFKVLNSFFKAIKILKDFKPDIAVGVGGYASFPILRMAQLANIPTLIQEQNSHAGKSNMILGQKAVAVCVAYDNMEKYFPKNSIIHTGNPVRAVISKSNISQKEAVAFFKLNETKKTILVIGGSLGAKSINDTMMLQHQKLLAEDVQIIWQTGTLAFEAAKASIANSKEFIQVHEFIQNMDMAYAAADVVISRAGALSIAELCIVGKPVVFVPFPHAAEDHQTANAMSLVNKNAALMVRDADAATELMTKTIQLLNDQMMQSLFTQRIKELAIIDADNRIVEQIKRITKA
jgi:UDP-N-acetylglucosamine--N-acetylmuramyl-(pentapeptide) pyrophosphoryl-undecaprenol N-acetylglucosamine transferase